MNIPYKNIITDYHTKVIHNYYPCKFIHIFFITVANFFEQLKNYGWLHKSRIYGQYNCTLTAIISKLTKIDSLPRAKVETMICDRDCEWNTH